ncbi:hypothetical protein ATANTOWER_015609 [Ataeniobius toweri]|uniref:Uncharacterized protein n=1 Tax=Ataeniobius toweri TaxID=208326 RepID=A0ABU7C0I2_9TELE|nr:hypothetical protein [Ataeniobius toweri]
MYLRPAQHLDEVTTDKDATVLPILGSGCTGERFGGGTGSLQVLPGQNGYLVPPASFESVPESSPVGTQLGTLKRKGPRAACHLSTSVSFYLLSVKTGQRLRDCSGNNTQI